MLTRPDDVDDERIRAELAVGWDFAVDALRYLAVGFGSHHWVAADADGTQLFLVVHDLTQMLQSSVDSVDGAFGRLAVAFECAVSLRWDEQLDFVVAPVRGVGGEVVRRLSARYSLAVCPYLGDCEPGHEGAFPAADRPAVLRLLTRLHRVRPRQSPQRCDFQLQNADALAAALASMGAPWEGGPYGAPARALLMQHAAGVTALMAAYGKLAELVSSRPNRIVVTHGEPGPWNVLKSPAGFVIVDWDFVRLAPPARDLWVLAENDASLLAAYTEATGTEIDDSALALFRMWYDLSEIAGYIDLFRGVHGDTEDAAESWKNLEYFLRPAERWPQLRPPVA